MTSSYTQRWTEALRSGKYKQGKGRLHHATTDEYCCLGVAADLDNAWINTPRTYVEDSITKAYYGPNNIFRNITVICPVTGDPKLLANCLWQLNDIYDWTFSQIADFIETVEELEQIDYSPTSSSAS